MKANCDAGSTVSEGPSRESHISQDWSEQRLHYIIPKRYNERFIA